MDFTRSEHTTAILQRLRIRRRVGQRATVHGRQFKSDDREVDRPGGTRRQRERHDRAALAVDRQTPTVLSRRYARARRDPLIQLAGVDRVGRVALGRQGARALVDAFSEVPLDVDRRWAHDETHLDLRRGSATRSRVSRRRCTACRRTSSSARARAHGRTQRRRVRYRTLAFLDIDAQALANTDSAECAAILSVIAQDGAAR